MYYPATPAQHAAITRLGLPTAARDLHYYIDPTGTAGWTLEWTSSETHLNHTTKWSDNGPDYTLTTAQHEEEGADYTTLTDRLNTIFNNDNLTEDSIVEVTLDAGALAPRIAALIAA